MALLEMNAKQQPTVFQRWQARLSRSERTRDLGPVGMIVRFVIMLALSLFFGLPLLWLVVAPSKTDAQFTSLSPLAFGSFAHIAEAWHNVVSYDHGIILTWTANSVLYAFGSILFQLVITITAGYALACLRFPGRRLLLTLTLIAMVLPTAAVVLPTFLEMNLAGLVNTPWSVILPAAFYPFGVYIAYIFYSLSLPKDLLAAGRMDGANEWQLFWNIGLPLSRALLGILSFLSFNANWNNFFGPFVMLQSDNLYNLPVGLSNLMSTAPALHPEFAYNTLPIHRAEIALIGLLMVAPVAIIYIFAQRSITSGALAGAAKE